MASIIAAALLMGLLLLAVALVVARSVEGESRALFYPSRLERSGAHRSPPGGLVSDPTVWAIAFVVGTLGVTAVVLLAVGDFGVAIPGGLAVVGAAFGLLVVVFLVAGSYAAVREREVSAAGALLVSTVLLGLLLLAVISAQLLLA